MVPPPPIKQQYRLAHRNASLLAFDEKTTFENVKTDDKKPIRTSHLLRRLGCLVMKTLCFVSRGRLSLLLWKKDIAKQYFAQECQLLNRALMISIGAQKIKSDPGEVALI